MEEVGSRFRAFYPKAQSLTIQGVFDGSEFVGTMQTAIGPEGCAVFSRASNNSVTTQNP